MQADAAGRLGLARTSGAVNQEAVMKHVIHALFLALIGTSSSAWSQEIGPREVDALPVTTPTLVERYGDAQLQFGERSEEHTSELQSLMRISYAVFCLKKKN